jgi:excinuclease UvrABC nuclease subunit
MDAKEFLSTLPKHRISKVVGIYFLLQDDEVVYVGQSQNVGQRVYDHVAKGKKRFNYCAVYKCSHLSHKEINRLESDLIVELEPKYNISVPTNDKYKTIEQLKVILRERGVTNPDGWTLKRWIRQENIVPVGMEHYNISDFEGMT